MSKNQIFPWRSIIKIFLSVCANKKKFKWNFCHGTFPGWSSILKQVNIIILIFNKYLYCEKRGRRDRMVVGFTTTSAISAYHH
jgi:hypothetical protein